MQKPRVKLNADNDDGVRPGIDNKRRRRAPVPYTPEDPAAKAFETKRKVTLRTLITSNGAILANNLNNPRNTTLIILIRTRRLCRSREGDSMLIMMREFDAELRISGVVGLLYHIHQKILLLRLIRLINGRQTTDAELSGRYP